MAVQRRTRRKLPYYLAAILVIPGMSVPAWAASEKALGAVVQAQSAHMDHEKAARGTTVYSGDSFDTEVGGTLRLRLGTSELSLLSRSAAVVSQDANAARVTVTGGTVEFSSAASGQLEIETPIAVIHGMAGQSAFGDVTLTGPQSLMVEARRGALVVEHDGEMHTIPEGKSYNVSLEPSEPLAAAAAAAAQNGEGVGTTHSHHKQLIFDAVLIGGAAVVATCLWGTAEGPSGFCH